MSDTEPLIASGRTADPGQLPPPATPESPQTSTPALAPADAAALDALAGSDWSTDAVAPELRDRAQRIAGLLAPITASRPASAADPSLLDAVLLRVARLREEGPAPAIASAVSLSADDAHALDALVEANFDAERVAPSLRDRARHQNRILSLVGAAPRIPAGADLVESTLARIQRAADGEAARLRLDSETAVAPRGLRFQFADLVSVAALLLIGTAVVWPMLTGVMQYNRRIACQANMATAGAAFGLYARDSRDMLPMASPSPAGNPWWQVGVAPDKSNSANLFTLARAGYTTVSDLACAGNPGACRSEEEAGASDWASFAQPSYSFRIMFGRPQHTLAPSAESILLADRAPITLVQDRGITKLRIFALQNSPNHIAPGQDPASGRGGGQNILRGDGSSTWMDSMVLPNGDNIWLPQGIEVMLRMRQPADPAPLNGTETPANNEDAHLGP